MINGIKIKAFIAVLFLITFPVKVFSGELTACFSVEVLIFKVGESCITYKDAGEYIIVESFIRTLNIASKAKKIEDKGAATLKKVGLMPKNFVFFQQEGGFKRFQRYDFEDLKIKMLEIKFKGLSDDIETNQYKTYPYTGQRDPFSAALFLFKEATRTERGYLNLFYDDRSYQIPYKFIGEEQIKISGNTFSAKKLLIKPEIKGKGLLRPKGDWYIWVDNETLLPVKMSVGFLIGSVNVFISSIEGERHLLKSF